MRISPTQFGALRAAILARFPANVLATIAAEYKARGLSAMRLRWDILHHSQFDARALYDVGLDDSHIDTALRAIMREIES